MKSLFSGLDEFGMDEVDQVEVFETPQVEGLKGPNVKVKSMAELLYDRIIKCPVCNNRFNGRTIRTGVNKFETTTLNLRPIYSEVDPIVYDVLQCEQCGYSALNRNFAKISERQIKMFNEKIGSKYKSKIYPEVYTYKMALERYKLALYTAVVIGSNDLNKAYLCLKTSWIIEGCIEESKDDVERIKYEEDRLSFIEHAFKGFEKAYDSIVFPVFGMNEPTYHYLLGVLAYELMDRKNAGFWLGKVLLSSSGHRRLKEKAREVKDLLEIATQKGVEA